jgi:kynurenine 3-monooxygenase
MFLFISIVFIYCISATKIVQYHYHIIGGGPVGLSFSLLLAKEGISSTVYESRNAIVDKVEESYPIGVNQRGLHTLGLISAPLQKAVSDTGKIVASWQIFAGKQQVAVQKSGVVVGTSRGKVNILLAEATKEEDKITMRYNMRLRDVRFGNKELVFENNLGKELIVPMAASDRVIGCDGVNSIVRQSMDRQEPSFKSKVTPWKCEFRVLFGNPDIKSQLLDETVHYIFSGVYCATVDNKGQQQWTCVIGVRDDCSVEERALLLSTDPSPDNVSRLRDYVRKMASWMDPLLSDQELTNYFSRRTYRGAVVECNRANVGDWLLLIGDAAHSVLPPTGEGINSGLEDAMVLSSCIKSNPEQPFSMYNSLRAPDIKGLVKYANYLNDSFDLHIPGESGARLAFMILESILKKCGIFRSDISEELFGAASVRRESYG